MGFYDPYSDSLRTMIASGNMVEEMRRNRENEANLRADDMYRAENADYLKEAANRGLFKSIYDLMAGTDYTPRVSGEDTLGVFDALNKNRSRLTNDLDLGGTKGQSSPNYFQQDLLNQMRENSGDSFKENLSLLSKGINSNAGEGQDVSVEQLKNFSEKAIPYKEEIRTKLSNNSDIANKIRELPTASGDYTGSGSEMRDAVSKRHEQLWNWALANDKQDLLPKIYASYQRKMDDVDKYWNKQNGGKQNFHDDYFAPRKNEKGEEMKPYSFKLMNGDKFLNNVTVWASAGDVNAGKLETMAKKAAGDKFKGGMSLVQGDFTGTGGPGDAEWDKKNYANIEAQKNLFEKVKKKTAGEIAKAFSAERGFKDEQGNVYLQYANSDAVYKLDSSGEKSLDDVPSEIAAIFKRKNQNDSSEIIPAGSTGKVKKNMKTDSDDELLK